MLAGLVAAAIAGLLVFYLSSSAAGPPTVVAAPTATPVPMQAVILAAHDIPARRSITASDVLTRSYPVDLVPADSFANLGAVLSQTSVLPVLAGEILVKRQFATADGRNGVSASLPAGKVLAAFPATDMLNATGAVQAGDHVDILITLPVSGTTTLGGDPATQDPGGQKALVTQATMQNVEVYSTGYWSPTTQPGASGDGVKVITFVVDRQEALILKYIKDSGGSIDLVVRSLADAASAPTDPVSLDYLVELYHFVHTGSQ
jgi:pilus assembly protein CpaB